MQLSSVILSSEVYPHSRKGRKKNRVSGKIEHFFSGFIIFLLCVIVMELVFHFFVSPSVLIDKVVVTADPGFIYSDDFLIKKAGLGSADTFFTVKPGVIEKRLMLIPAIRSVSVIKKFPSVLKIDIVSRVPVGLFLISNGSGIVPSLIDREGVLFLTGYNAKYVDLPIISGLEFPEIKDGMRMPKALCSFLEDMDSIKRSSPDLYRIISEIKFIKKGISDYDVLLYPKNYKTRIRIGDSIDEKMLKYIVMVLEVISNQPGMEKLEELDFRTGDIVYRIQEE